MSINYVSECLGFKIVKLFDQQKEALTELGITLRQDNLRDLFNFIATQPIDFSQMDFHTRLLQRRVCM